MALADMWLRQFPEQRPQPNPDLIGHCFRRHSRRRGALFQTLTLSCKRALSRLVPSCAACRLRRRHPSYVAQGVQVTRCFAVTRFQADTRYTDLNSLYLAYSLTRHLHKPPQTWEHQERRSLTGLTRITARNLRITC